MTAKLSEVLKSCFKLELNFISESEEIELIAEVMKKLKFMRWDEGHFDGKIQNYREHLLSDVSQFPRLNELFNSRVLKQMMSKRLLPIHMLELRYDGLIMPHVDNKTYSGSIIAGLSLQRDSIMTISNSVESKEIILPRRSFYRQIDDLRFNYNHSISFKGLKSDIHSRISLIFRDVP